MAKYYSSKDEKMHDIPKAPVYVLSNDSFLSGWGPASGTINTCVVPCLDWSEAVKVEDYLRSRGDQKRVRIVCNPPRTKKHVLYSLVTGWRKQAGLEEWK